MANETRLSLLNPLRLVPVEDAIPARFHSRTFDQALQEYTLHLGEERNIYVAPVERGDPLKFQVSTTAKKENVKLQIIDCNGHAVLTVPNVSGAVIPGNKAADGTQLNSFSFSIPSYAGITEDGQYYLLLTVNYYAPEAGQENNGFPYSFPFPLYSEIGQQFISNPFYLADLHEDTLLINYQDKINRLSTYFEQLPGLFTLRVGGILDSFEVATNTTTFEDQNKTLVQLRSVPYRRWTLRVGGNGIGISDSLLDTLNNVFTCSGVYIDSRPYIKDDGAGFEKVSEVLSPVFGASITLREANPGRVGMFTDSKMKLWVSPGTYPYAVGQVALAAENDISRLFNGMKVINSLSEETAFLAQLEAAAGNVGANGSVIKEGNAIYYNNGLGIQYSLAYAKVLPSYFSFKVSALFAAQTVAPTFKGANFLVDFGDGTAPLYLGDSTGAPSLVQPYTINHTYAAFSIYDFRVFHSGTEVTEVYFKGAAGALGPVTGITGNLPAITVLDLSFSEITTFDFGILGTSLSTLGTLALNNCPNLQNGSYSSVQPFKKLKNWRFQSCKLSKTVVEGLINQALNTARIYGIRNGYLNIRTQTPPVTISVAAQFSAQTLATYGWTVLT